MRRLINQTLSWELVLLGLSAAAVLLVGCDFTLFGSALVDSHDAALVGKWLRVWSLQGTDQEQEVMSWQLSADGTGAEEIVDVLTMEPTNRTFTWSTADNELNLLYADTGEQARFEYQVKNSELSLAGIDAEGVGLQVLVQDSQSHDPRLVGDWFMTDALEYQEDTHASWGGESIYRADGTVDFVYQYEWTADQPTYRTVSATWTTSGDYILYSPTTHPDLAEAHPYTISADGTTFTTEIPEIGGTNTLVAHKTLGQHDTSLIGRWTQTGRTEDGVAQAFEPVTWTFNSDGTAARDFQTTADDTLSWETNTGTWLFIQQQNPNVLGYGYAVQYSLNGNTLTFTYPDVSLATPVNIVDTYQQQ